MSIIDAGWGKYGGPPRVVRTSEVEDPRVEIRRRMVALGASDEMVVEALDAHQRGRVDLRTMSDDDLRARIGALAEGTEIAWAEADRRGIEDARRDPILWAEINTDPTVDGKIGVIGQGVGKIMKWVGQDAGRAVLAHYAELERASDEGRDPRRTLIPILRLIHGQGDLAPLSEG